MDNVTIVFLITHVILYLAWKMTALDEKNSRSDGRQIPTYATGGLGNLIGFSLLTVGVSYNVETFFRHPWLFYFAIAALVTTVLLHVYWQHSVQNTTASLYMPDGTTTLAGWLHLVYVLFIAFMSFLFLAHISSVSVLELSLALGGMALYVCAVMIDRYRGVI